MPLENGSHYMFWNLETYIWLNHFYYMDNMAPFITIKIIHFRWCGTLGGDTIILQWFKNEY